MRDIVRLAIGAALGAATLSSSLPLEAQAVGAPVDSAARDVLERHIAAIGGRELLGSIRTVEIRQDREVFGQMQKAYSISEVATGRTYTRMEGSNGVTELGFDGRRAWRRTPFFRGYLEESDPGARALMNRQRPIHEYRESGVPYVRLPNEQVEERELIVLGSERTDPMGRRVPVKLYFDPQTYLLMRRVEGEAVTSVSTFADYRPVDGRLVAFTTTTQNPQATVTARVQTIRYNVPVADSIFQFREAGAAPADSSAAAAPPRNPGQPATPLPEIGADDAIAEPLRRETFEQVWRTVRDTYWDTAFGGVNWQAVHDRYMPRALATERSDAFHRILSEMVAELGQSHFRVTPPHQVLTPSSSQTERNTAETGMRLQWVSGALLVERVDDSSSARTAGLRPGYAIASIDGKSPDQIYQEFRSRNRGAVLREEILRARAAQMALAGRAGSVVSVRALNERGDTVTVSLPRVARPSVVPTEIESRRLDKDVGYIRLGMFGPDVLPRFREALRPLSDASALIIDLRANPGGVGDVAAGIASLLSERDGSLGVSRFRYETRQHAFKGSGAGAYKGRVVLLVDERTGSAGEVFSAGLQELGRAKVVGRTTAGAVLPSIVRPLPTGGVLQHAISEYRTPRGTRLEGRGVVPDVEAPRPTREALLEGKDAALELALRVVKERA